ncbi:hypothetical protein EI42_03662 [Thermosporothrix hazakensis]|uniref:WD40 repeat protein n=1 Tax=Thermosporothrix hazakensis TaxID=644383 RepID=A0A326U3U6_THEHA|nr:hypothetical protein [Thermosporothrix hazakensis]PZW27099.1 hypothetical protein EI42_03662 [Thermosporothrix hazakensis]GCE50383.1 hypothetical protein KTH_52520 [Thermosporothrix hazakensis]
MRRFCHHPGMFLLLFGMLGFLLPLTTGQAHAAVTPNPQKVDYAYVYNNQLYLSKHGNVPQQVTHFSYENKHPLMIYFDQPVWLSDDRYVAFKLKATDNGGGGGGCGYTNLIGRYGQLFIYDTVTQKLVTISLPGDPQPASGLYDGNWAFLFQQDNNPFHQDKNHLLAWHRQGLYIIDLTRLSTPQQAVHQLVRASDLPGVENHYQARPMRYTNNNLYYEASTLLDGQSAHPKLHMEIYAVSLNNPTRANKVADAGTVPLCLPSPDGRETNIFQEPGWDVSALGTIAWQHIVQKPDKSYSSSIQTKDLDQKVTTVFTRLPSQAFTHSIRLSWSPDGGFLLANTRMYDGPPVLATISMRNPDTTFFSYQGQIEGDVSWQPANAKFTLSFPLAPSSNGDVVEYTLNNASGTHWQVPANSFAWGQTA